MLTQLVPIKMLLPVHRLEPSATRTQVGENSIIRNLKINPARQNPSRIDAGVVDCNTLCRVRGLHCRERGGGVIEARKILF